MDGNRLRRRKKKTTKQLRKQAKKLGIRLTVKRQGKRVYKSDKVLQKQIRGRGHRFGNDDMITLEIRGFTGPLMEITINKNATVLDLMEAIRSNTNAAIPGMLLKFDGEELEETNKTLSELGIEDGATISYMPLNYGPDDIIKDEELADDEFVVILTHPTNGEFRQVKVVSGPRARLSNGYLKYLKECIKNKWGEGYPVSGTKLIHDGNIMKGNKQVKKYGVKHRDIITFTRDVSTGTILHKILRILDNRQHYDPDEPQLSLEQIIARIHMNNHSDYDIIQLGIKKGIESGLIRKIENPEEAQKPPSRRRKWKGHFYVKTTNEQF